MTVTEPIPASGTGLATWQDYIHNWREEDTDFIQERLISRFADATERDAAYLTPPSAGRVIYRGDVGYLEMSTGSSWVSYRPMPQYMDPFSDTSGQVGLAHSGASGQGVVLTPTYVGTNADFRAKGGVLTVDSTGVSVTTGTKTAKLTTDATSLVSDSPISAPSVTLTGGGTVFSAPGKTIAVGTVNADSGTFTNFSVTGTLSGGVISSPSGTIANVSFASTAGAGRVTAADGFRSVNGLFYGGDTAATMRHISPTGVLGAAYLQVLQDRIVVAGPEYTVFYNTVYIENNTGPVRSMPWTTPGADAYLAPVIYSTTDPGAANYPNGTIWIS